MSSQTSSSSSVVSIEKFNGKNNFSLWRIKIRALLKQQGIWASIAGTKPYDTTDANYMLQEENAHSTILLCLSDEVLYEVGDEETEKRVWKKLETIYMKKLLTNKLLLKQRLFSLRMKEGLSLKGPLDALNSILMDLKNVEVKIEDEDATLVLLVSLPPSFESFVSSFVVGVDIDLKKIKDKCGASSSSRGPNPRDICNYCKETGHWKIDCPKLKEKLKALAAATTKDNSCYSGPYKKLNLHLQRGHANLLCIVPILSDVPEGTRVGNPCPLYKASKRFHSGRCGIDALAIFWLDSAVFFPNDNKLTISFVNQLRIYERHEDEQNFIAPQCYAREPKCYIRNESAGSREVNASRGHPSSTRRRADREIGPLLSFEELVNENTSNACKQQKICNNVASCDTVLPTESAKLIEMRAKYENLLLQFGQLGRNEWIDDHRMVYQDDYLVGKQIGIHDFLSANRKTHWTTSSLICTPGQHVPPEALASQCLAWVKGLKGRTKSYVFRNKLNGLLADCERISHLQAGGNGSIRKTVNELHAMLKLHEETLPKKDANPALHAIRAGRVQKNQKNKPHKAAKRGHGKGKGKMGYAPNNAPFSPKPKTPPPPKKDNPAKDTGLRGSKKLKPGALSLYVAMDHRAPVLKQLNLSFRAPYGLVIV
ncbi:retrovirus-related pol polyprotein from transposon TNT 1-94 [Tanacetum coccineum]